MWGRYERGEAVPGMEVMERFAAIGAKPGVLLGTEAPDAWDPLAAEWALLDQIAVELGLWKGNLHIDRLEEIEAQLREDRRLDAAHDYDEAVTPHVNGANMMREWLAESPYVFRWSDSTLEAVIELLEYTLSVTGKTMPPGDKARAIVALLKAAKADQWTSPDSRKALLTSVKTLVDKLPS